MSDLRDRIIAILKEEFTHNIPTHISIHIKLSNVADRLLNDIVDEFECTCMTVYKSHNLSDPKCTRCELEKMIYA